MLVSAKTKRILRIAVAVFGFWIYVAPASESIYKWIDDDGSVHFSDHPPSEAKKSERLSIESSPSKDVVREAEAKRDSIRAAQRSRHDQRVAAREQERLLSESEQARRDDRRQRCTKAREEIQSLDHHMPIYYIDETGNQVFLEDKERADLIEFYRREVAMFCD